MFHKAKYQSESQPYVDALRCVRLRPTSRTFSFERFKPFSQFLERTREIITKLQGQPYQIKISAKWKYT